MKKDMTESKLKNRKGSGKKEGECIEETAKQVKRKPDLLPKFSNQRLWSRGVFITALLVFVWFNSKKTNELVLAKRQEIVNNKGQKFDCDPNYLKDSGSFPECIPNICGRLVTDKLITVTEAETLLKIAKRGFALGSSEGGASIFDLHSGALSFKSHFVNVLSIEKASKLLDPVDISAYKLVKSKIQNAIAKTFDITPENLYLTKPTFFSKLSSEPPVTEHDKYWLPHIDKETYGSFHYTSLLYLSDYGVDFKGGRLIFIDESKKVNVTVEPKMGRVAIFTSGAENLHFVERVTNGVRYAITISFTCDKSFQNVDTILGINL